MKLAVGDASGLGRIPLPAWANVLSLDAVFVAVVWQQLLMRVFCSRSTRWPEGVALGLTVWLIYVADRLLDGAKLDVQRPHTLRHRFYRRHRRLFMALWIVGLLANTLVVVRWLPMELVRNGLFLASAVLVYGASVHFTSQRSRPERLFSEGVAAEDVAAADVSAGHCAAQSVACESGTGDLQWLETRLPKEVRVGLLFALGISLTTWTEWFSSGQASAGSLVHVAATAWPLLAATCALAVLFSWNCILVARFECVYDRAQAFPSIATRPDRVDNGSSRTRAQVCLAAALVGLPLGALLLLALPLPLEIAGLASALGLLVSVFLPASGFCRRAHIAAAGSSPPMFDVRSAWVDAVLWTPPLVLLCWM